MRLHRRFAFRSVVLVACILWGCSGSNDQVTVLELVPPTTEAQVADTPGGTDGEEGEDAQPAPDEDVVTDGIGDDPTGDTTPSDGGSSSDDPATTPDGTPGAAGDAAGPSDQEIAAAVAEAVKATSNVAMDFKIEEGSAIAGRTACTGVADTSTQYPIGLELIVGPPGNVGSGTPRIVARTYDDAAMAKSAAGARIASLKSCVANATVNNPALEWGTVAVDQPMTGEQLWFPAGAVTETHVAYAVEQFYIVVSNQVPAATFVPGQVDAWSVSAVQAVMDTIEAEANPNPNPNPTPTPEGQ